MQNTNNLYKVDFRSLDEARDKIEALLREKLTDSDGIVRIDYVRVDEEEGLRCYETYADYCGTEEGSESELDLSEVVGETAMCIQDFGARLLTLYLRDVKDGRREVLFNIEVQNIP